jgi:alpha-L-arabinofuranosidase
MSRYLFALSLLLGGTTAFTQTAYISIDAAQDLGEVNAGVMGTNIRVYNSEQYTFSLLFQSRMEELATSLVRWPGGNESGPYNWKIDGYFRDTLATGWGIGIADIAEICQELDADLEIAVNFGTMSAQDAADLVEFCNGPSTSEWGHLRDSLGFPEPLNVTYWEIGNEIDCEHMWHFSWTAQDPEKYFFGGSEERRGWLPPSPFGSAFKGDSLRSDGSPNQEMMIRFPDIEEGTDSLWVGPDTSHLELWTGIEDLGAVESGAFYEIDYENAIVRFGNGRHGDIPSAGDLALYEYTTINHDGYVDFVDAMKAVDPTIKVGACMLPEATWSPDTIDEILKRMDFRIIHWYRHEDSTAVVPYYARMTAPQRYIKQAYAARENLDTWPSIYARNIQLAFTEWNWILWEGTLTTPATNISLASALFTSDVLGRLITESDNLKIAMANHFAAPACAATDYLGLISSTYRKRPAFYAFRLFSGYFGERIVQRRVQSDTYTVMDDTVSFVTAYASRNVGGDTLYLVAINKHDSLGYETTIEISGFEPDSAAWIHTINGDSIEVTNEHDSMSVTIRDSLITTASTAFVYTLPAHSVTAMVLTQPPPPADDDTLLYVTAVAPSAPNPFAASTTIEYSVGQHGPVELKVYNLLGQLVKTLIDHPMDPGPHTAVWNGDDEEGIEVASGLYFVALKVRDEVAARKLLLLR